MKRWWQKQIKKGAFTRTHAFLLALAIATIVNVLSSPVGKVWFVVVVVGGVLVATFLYVSRKGGEQ